MGSEGKVGNAINLKDNFYSTEYTQPSGSFSASFWMKTGAVLKDPAIFTNKGWDDARDVGYICFVQSDRIGFNAGNGIAEGTNENRADFYTTNLPTEFQNNEWFHVVCVVNIEQDTIRFAFNFGELVEADRNTEKGIGALSDMQFNNGNKLRIGTDINGNNGFSNDGFVSGNAYMDDFMFFDKALTDDDVDALKAYYYALVSLS
jgi:hypothetical protein